MKPLTLRLISTFCLWSVFVFAELRFLPKTSNERLQTDFVLFYLLPNQITVTFCSIRNIGCNVTLRLLLHSRPAPNSRVFPPDLVNHRGLSFCSLNELFRGGERKKQYILPF